MESRETFEGAVEGTPLRKTCLTPPSYSVAVRAVWIGGEASMRGGGAEPGERDVSDGAARENVGGDGMSDRCRKSVMW